MTDRLRELAAAATPGPWQFEYAGQFGKMGEVELYGNAQLPDEGDLIAVFSRDDNEQGAEPNAAYVAAVSPDVVLALLDERDALRKKPRVTSCEYCVGSCGIEEYEDLRVERDALAAALEEVTQIAEHPAKPRNALDGIASIARAALAAVSTPEKERDAH